MEPVVTGDRLLSETRFGPLIHAKLGVAAENSGKMVSLLRKQSREVAQKEGVDLILVDGSPGIGCPVIASITGADLVVAVVEPTLSGLHDLGRVGDLVDHFGIRACVCINKWDLSPEMGVRIEAWTSNRGFRLVGRVRYDPAVTGAQVSGVPVVEYSAEGASEDIRALWSEVREFLDSID